MNKRHYYKVRPRDFIADTAELRFEAKAAYRLILDLLYLQAGALSDDSRYISNVLGCSVRKWKSLRAELIQYGKIRLIAESSQNRLKIIGMIKRLKMSVNAAKTTA